MPTRVRIFISAAPEEDPAREQIGRALAELPVNIGWVIKRTPDVDSVPECHLYALVLGTDIWAPVGLELWWARRTEKPILAYARDAGRTTAGRTPAGQAFLQENAYLDWRRYTDLSALRRAFLRDVCRFLLAHTDRYGVTVVEAETLRGFVAQLEQPAPAPPAAKARGAGGGGVILAPGKDVPVGARLVEGTGSI
jgi:hypothetical protein